MERQVDPLYQSGRGDRALELAIGLGIGSLTRITERVLLNVEIHPSNQQHYGGNCRKTR
jgi:hypothetical protein